MRDVSPESPEARQQRLLEKPEHAHRFRLSRLKPGAKAMQVMKRVAIGVYTDGFIHAGNLAYMSLLTLFPFFIVAAAITSFFGRTDDGLATVNGFLQTVPPSVAEVLRAPINQVINARLSSGVLWLGGIVGLWSVGSLIETIRDILRRAYGTQFGRAFWQYRLGSIGIIIVSVFAMMFAFSLQLVLQGAEEFLVRILPFADDAIQIVTASKVVPMAILTLALYSLFVSLTPSKYRGSEFPKWPGALLTAGWWYGTLILLPIALSHLSSYDLTYGSLAGVMITLIFFFLVGLGVVIGAELNAALAEFPNGETAPVIQE
ncbi:MAG: YihY/virulence factor BrkB family protein [Sphingobium sp.]